MSDGYGIVDLTPLGDGAALLGIEAIGGEYDGQRTEISLSCEELAELSEEILQTLGYGCPE